MADVLIIDDDIEMCAMLSDLLQSLNHKPTYALTLAEGIEKAQSGRFDVVFLDVRMPDGSGLDILNPIRETPSAPEVIIMTGLGDPDGAEIAIQNGAWDYIQKPFSAKEIMLPLMRVLQYRDYLKTARQSPVVLNRQGIIGDSPKLMECLTAIAQAANTDANILLAGETGTGKELFARALHINSPRSAKDFVIVDCAALPGTLIESTLFGHEKGAFTGAEQSKEGLIKHADGGTLFLDEVGEMGLEIQKAFLRILQERRFRRVGGKRELKSDFRLIAATNKDLDQMVKGGQFREDLLHRLRTITIKLPLLRERKEDLVALAVHYAMKICRKYGLEAKGFSPEFYEAIGAYPWPGNVREFINVLEESIYKAQKDPTLIPQHLPNRVRVAVARSAVRVPKVSASKNVPNETVKQPALPPYRLFKESVLDDAEKRYLQDLIGFARGNMKKACQISGLGRSRLYALMKKHNISRFGWPSA